ncbi:hypothetical protein KY334_02325 [Candidatus Woesearchaeota archaeon]|nr:hypothetical protein [Candidatus Woesearchaeota archaeon]
MDSKAFMGLFIAFLMLGGMFGIFMSGSQGTSKFRYNDFIFKYDESGILYTEFNDEQVFFRYSPSSVNGSDIPQDFVDIVKNTNKIYYTRDLNENSFVEVESLGYDLAQNLFNTHELYVHVGVTDNTSAYFVDCSMATLVNPVIYVKQSNESKVTYDNYCLTAEVRDNYDVYILRDELLYRILGVI